MSETNREETHGKAPECPKHRVRMTEILKRANGEALAEGDYAEFLCLAYGCPSVARVARPNCAYCMERMTIRIHYAPIDVKLFQSLEWECTRHRDKPTQKFEICECGGAGWIEMDNSDGDRDDILGHPFGKHIERCDGCGHLRFESDIGAERAHRRECGCGWGLPMASKTSVWIDYPGVDGRIATRMRESGFSVLPSGENVEIIIHANKSHLFVCVLDAAHDELLAPSSPGRMAAKSVLFGHNLLTETGRISSKEMNLSNPPRPGTLTLTEEVELLREKITGLELREKSSGERYESLRKSAYRLLSQLNGMSFQDHSIADQRQLELARRGLVEGLHKVHFEPSSLHDSAAVRADSELLNVGGYRLEDLERVEDEAVLFGTCYLGGIYYHVTLIEVTAVDGEQRPVNDPQEWYYDLVGKFNNEAMATVKVPGFPGDYVLCIYPRSV